MLDEQLHKKIEEYIFSSLDGKIKFSLTPNNPRDFSLPDAPYLSDGTEPFIIFKVSIQRGSAAAIGNTTKRRLGVIRAEIYRNRDTSDREQYRLLDIITPFLERKSFNGVLLKDASESGEYNSGNWTVTPWTFNFKTTQTLT